MLFKLVEHMPLFIQFEGRRPVVPNPVNEEENFADALGRLSQQV